MSVDRDRFVETGFTWVAPAGVLNQLPRGCKPRHVRGLSATSGRTGTATVPTITSGVWTGADTTFTVEADDGTLDTMTITRRIGEHPSLA